MDLIIKHITKNFNLEYYNTMIEYSEKGDIFYYIYFNNCDLNLVLCKIKTWFIGFIMYKDNKSEYFYIDITTNNYYLLEIELNILLKTEIYNYFYDNDLLNIKKFFTINNNDSDIIFNITDQYNIILNKLIEFNDILKYFLLNTKCVIGGDCILYLILNNIINISIPIDIYCTSHESYISIVKYIRQCEIKFYIYNRHHITWCSFIYNKCKFNVIYNSKIYNLENIIDQIKQTQFFSFKMSFWDGKYLYYPKDLYLKHSKIYNTFLNYYPPNALKLLHDCKKYKDLGFTIEEFIN